MGEKTQEVVSLGEEREDCCTRDWVLRDPVYLWLENTKGILAIPVPTALFRQT